VLFSEAQMSNGCESFGFVTTHEAKVALGNSYDQLYVKRGVDTLLGSEPIDPNRTFYLYIQPIQPPSTLNPTTIAGTCTEVAVRKPLLGSLKQLFPLRRPTGDDVIVTDITNEDKQAAQLGLDLTAEQGFEFEQSDGATSYELVVQFIDKGASHVIYDVERPATGNCALTVGDHTRSDTNRAWLSWKFDCAGIPVPNEPSFSAWAQGRPQTLWRVYAKSPGPISLRRTSWNFSDTPPVSADNTFFNFTYDHVPPRAFFNGVERDYLWPNGATDPGCGVPGFDCDASATSDLGLGIPVLTYPAKSVDPVTHTFAIQQKVEPNKPAAFKYCFFQPPPMVQGYLYWFFVEGQPAGPAKTFDPATATVWPTCFEQTIPGRPSGDLTIGHFVTVPFVDTFAGSQGRVFAKKAVDTVSAINFHSATPPTPPPSQTTPQCPTKLGAPTLQADVFRSSWDFSKGPFVDAAIECESVPQRSAPLSFFWTVVKGAKYYRVSLAKAIGGTLTVADFSKDVRSPPPAKMGDPIPPPPTFISFPDGPPVLGGDCGGSSYFLFVEPVDDCDHVGIASVGRFIWAAP